MVEIGGLASKIGEVSVDAKIEEASADTKAEKASVDSKFFRYRTMRNPKATEQPSVKNFVSSIGWMPEYKLSDDWSDYNDRLNQYFLANEISEDERKVALLVTLISKEAYAVLKDICDPLLPGQKSYEELCTVMSRYFSKKVCSFKERVKFFEMKQNEDETVNAWFRRIKKKARICDFKDRTEDAVKDKFVTGMYKGPILDRLWEESDERSLEEMFDIAVKKEAAMKKIPKLLKNLQEFNWYFAILGCVYLVCKYKVLGVIFSYIIFYFLYLIMDL